jgi:hypothetical protein
MNRLYYVFACLLLVFQTYAQSVTITPGTTEPAIDAKTDQNGVKIPMMSSYERKDIANPTIGLMVFDKDLKALYLYNGNNWMRLAVTADDTPLISELMPNYSPIDFGNTTSFGESIAYQFPYLVVGDPDENKVTIWQYNDNKFTIHSVLQPSMNVQPEDARFGKSVAVYYFNSEYYLAVGHPRKKYNANSFVNHGAVHIYKLVSNIWTYQIGIYPGSTTTDDQFGYSVSLVEGSDNKLTLWAGAPFDDLDSSPNTSNVGSTFVFTKNPTGTGWTQKTKFQDAAANSNNQMGWCVSASYGDYSAAGAPGNNAGRGAIYAYKYNSGTTNYDLLTKIIPTDVAAGDGFGSSVYVRLDEMIGGSPYADVSGNADQGKAYTYYLPSSFNNYRESIFTDASGQANDNYGYSVGLYFEALAIGAPNKMVNNRPQAGAVFYILLGLGSEIFDIQVFEEINSGYNVKFGRALVVSSDPKVFVSSLGGTDKKGQISVVVPH